MSNAVNKSYAATGNTLLNQVERGFNSDGSLSTRHSFQHNQRYHAFHNSIYMDESPRESSAPSEGMQKLMNRLLEYYPAEHDAIIYEASFSPAWKPRVDVVHIADLGDVPVNGISTLVIPPSSALPIDRDIAEMIGIEAHHGGQSTHSTSLKMYRDVATNRTR